MFSALKRLVGNQNDNKSVDDFFILSNGKGFSRSGVHPMGYQLQKEFSRGVQYNMKIIIKGDRNVGKSCLFKRLQGLPFDDEYKPTEEIQVTNIHWNYKATDDIVKVEVWDVVDKGRKYSQMNGLKIDNKSRQENVSKEEQERSQLALDAEFIDVYKATNGVIMMLDITKAWTFDYIQRELPKVPLNIPALVLANHRDMGHHRAISEDQVKVFIESLGRDKGPGQIRYAESSMSNGFGLKFLHKFFNLPFLHLQRETLKKQLETNQSEIETTYEELDILQESDEQRYDKFLEMITNRRRAIADKLSQTVQPSVGPTRSVSMPVDLAKNKTPQASSGASEIVKPNPSIIIGATKPFANVNKVQQSHISKTETVIETDEDQIRFRTFLTESISEVEFDDRFEKVEEEKEESEDEKMANPMVSGYQEELDPEDDLPPVENLPINEIEIGHNSTSTQAFSNVPNEMQSNDIQKTGLLECASNFDNQKDTDYHKAFEVDKKRENVKNKLVLTHEPTSQSSEVVTTKEVKSGRKRKEKGKKKSTKDEKGRRKVSEEDEDRRKLEEFLEPSPDLFSKREVTEYELL